MVEHRDGPIWEGGRVAFATKHGKEQQFALPFRAVLGAELSVASVDTDELGTFTGETPRPAGQLETARRKAAWGIEVTGHRYGLASEGAFGPHPHIPFMTAGIELALFVDSEQDLEVVEHRICPETNFSHIELTTPEVPPEYLHAAGFPDHALVVSPSATGPFVKSIVEAVELEAAVRDALATGGTALIQTDMRAHLNPTRQRSLRLLAEQLAERLASRCPSCDQRGWGVIERVPGLPCEWCDSPTNAIAADRWQCASSRCRHEELRARDGTAAPEMCPRCNP